MCNRPLRILFVLLVLQVVVTGCATKEPASDIPYYPRMPDAYRNNDYYHKTKQGSANINPAGYAIYDHAESEAEDDYFGVEVVPLEESQRILKERRAKEKQTIPKD